MIQSAWKCPRTKQPLFITKSGRYWCIDCQSEHDAAAIDPANRDYARMSIITDSAIERQLGVSFEQRY